MDTPRQLKRPSGSAAPEDQSLCERENTELMEQVVAKDNVVKALEKLEKEKKGTAPGIDGMEVEDLREYLRESWPRIKEKLLGGQYQPQPVRRTEIPKDGGGKRKLGIPTVLDRFIQLALLEVLTPIFEPIFSDRSYGFRPGRSQHQAVRQAQSDIQDKRWVVDIDISKFFDTVNHDRLMARLSRYIGDKRVLKLIGRYLRAGVMINGVVMETYQGTPQGGPLSPLLSNIVLDELDKELKRRGHSFVRYADDGQVYVGSKRAAKRVMESLIRFLEEKLKLKINQEKSAVDLVYRRTYLGFSFYVGAKGRVRIRLARKTIDKVKDKIREITKRNRPINIKGRIDALNQYLIGWLGYFSLADCKSHLRRITEWMRRRLRVCYLKQWKRCRTRLRKLRGLGLDEKEAIKMAMSRKGYWALSKTEQLHKALNNEYFEAQGLVNLLSRYSAFRESWRTAGGGTA